MKPLKRKRCQTCGRKAKFTVNVIVSTLGETPRRQASSKAMRFCFFCLTSGAITKASAKARIHQAAFACCLRVNNKFECLQDAFNSGNDSTSHAAEPQTRASNTVSPGSVTGDGIRHSVAGGGLRM